MTTNPETIAELKRLLEKYNSDRQPYLALEAADAASNALPSLLSDLEAAQKRERVLREALAANLWWYQDTPSNMSHNEYRAEQLRLKQLTELALVSTEAK